MWNKFLRLSIKKVTFIEEQENRYLFRRGCILHLSCGYRIRKAPVLNNPDKEEIRKAIQLAILKGMKKSVQVNHQMTPDAIGLLVSYFVKEMTKDKKELSILDPALGTGNLLYTIMNMLP